MAPRSLFVVAGPPTLNRKQGLTPQSLADPAKPRQWILAELACLSQTALAVIYQVNVPIGMLPSNLEQATLFPQIHQILRK